MAGSVGTFAPVVHVRRAARGKSKLIPEWLRNCLERPHALGKLRPSMSSHTTAPLKTGAQAGLCLGALGVVFGDIGTSPLYTMKECLAHLPSGDPTEGVLGILSLIFWALVLVVGVKYLWYVMSADNQGEGGIFAL